MDAQETRNLKQVRRASKRTPKKLELLCSGGTCKADRATLRLSRMAGRCNVSVSATSKHGKSGQGQSPANNSFSAGQGDWLRNFARTIGQRTPPSPQLFLPQRTRNTLMPGPDVEKPMGDGATIGSCGMNTQRQVQPNRSGRKTTRQNTSKGAARNWTKSIRSGPKQEIYNTVSDGQANRTFHALLCNACSRRRKHCSRPFRSKAFAHESNMFTSGRPQSGYLLKGESEVPRGGNALRTAIKKESAPQNSNLLDSVEDSDKA